jgi:hypothetical protein
MLPCVIGVGVGEGGRVDRRTVRARRLATWRRRGGMWCARRVVALQYGILVVGGLLERVCSRFGVLRFGCWMRKSDVTFGGRAGPCGFD